jgi:hypothetical protein
MRCWVTLSALPRPAGSAKVSELRIEVSRLLSGDLAESAWRLYTEAFAELRTAAVQRHVMHRHEFDEVMADERVLKYFSTDADRSSAVSALATFTNDLESMPLISPDYFAHRWPALFADRRIWYLGFFAVKPSHRSTGIFEGVIDRMWQNVVASDGMGALDICRHNDEAGLPQAIHRALDSFTDGVRVSRIDEQAYWIFEPPASA